MCRVPQCLHQQQGLTELHQQNQLSSMRGLEVRCFHPLLCLTFSPIHQVTEAVCSEGSTKPKPQECLEWSTQGSFGEESVN